MKCERDIHLTAVFILVVLLGMAPPLMGGGPLHVVPGTGGIFKWDSRLPVNFTIDQGPLGTKFNSPAEAAQFVRDAAQAWTDVSSATVSFRDNGFLPMDITAENYRSFFGIGQQNELQRPENPIIFDSDGGITDDLLGEGSNAFILGSGAFSGAGSWPDSVGGVSPGPVSLGVGISFALFARISYIGSSSKVATSIAFVSGYFIMTSR